MNKFTVMLTESCNEEIQQFLSKMGYNTSYVTKLKPELIFVEHEKGSVEELLSFDFVTKARPSRVYELGI